MFHMHQMQCFPIPKSCNKIMSLQLRILLGPGYYYNVFTAHPFLADISGFGTDNLSLVQGLREAHIRRWVTKEQHSWRMMNDVFKCINKITRTEEQMKAYNEPMYDSVSHMATERINEVSQGEYSKPKTPSKIYNGPHFRPCNNSHFDTPGVTNSHQCSRNHGRSQFSHSQNSLKCYCCEGKHHSRDCDKFTQDKVKYKLKITDIMQKCKDITIQKTRKDNVSINEATSSTGQGSTYYVKQAEQLLGNMQFRDSESGSDWLDRYIQEVTIDDINLENVILYKVKVNNLEVETLYDTCASISVMAKYSFDRLQNKPKLIRYNRNISGAGGEALILEGECFLQLQIIKKTF